MSNSLDLDQAPHFVGPDLGPNCLQKLSADDNVTAHIVVIFLNLNKQFMQNACNIQFVELLEFKMWDL